MVEDMNTGTYRQQILRDGRPAFIECWAAWCVYSLLLKPKTERIARRFGDRWLVARLNVDEHPDLAHDLKMDYVPGVALIQGGKVVKRWYGDRHIQEFIKAIHSNEVEDEA